ncbi:30S ribosomal protein S11 [Candidatus Microgenomates bacterium]|nr:30S ribosomal protein S11 [Candidatus Microgenomates bacterium]
MKVSKQEEQVASKKVQKQVSRGRAYITATFNNTLITITDAGGNAVAWGSAGASGFKGARKATPYAAMMAMENVARKAREMGMADVEVFVKGPGAGRDTALKALKTVGLNIMMIADVTPIPHNGCRPKKRRRV